MFRLTDSHPETPALYFSAICSLKPLFFAPRFENERATSKTNTSLSEALCLCAHEEKLPERHCLYLKLQQWRLIESSTEGVRVRSFPFRRFQVVERKANKRNRGKERERNHRRNRSRFAIVFSPIRYEYAL